MRPSEQKIMSLGSGLVGLTFAAAAALCADLAREHMAMLGRLCGTGEAVHCGWCYAAVGFTLAGVSALAAAMRPAIARAATASEA